MNKLSFAAGLILLMLMHGYAFADGTAGDGSQLRHDDPGRAEVSIASHGPASTTVVIETLAVAVKETESTGQLARFGEVYAFSPSFFAVYRNQPTRIRLWNLQPDDPHNFTLSDPKHRVLMSMMLAPLAKRSMVVTFHRRGLYTFSCNIHQPEMNGQILVLPSLH